ncbi:MULTISPECIES: DUF551 domain-containing protein [unclassified Serratia (in: enterobacteria)]|uniref:DUF551 domain-containing protein n=1 Tax=unclassified Serratia (in: enterobacteria) TaxID=2647522 RepID=UPI0030766175
MHKTYIAGPMTGSCGDQHKQLAGWLSELLAAREARGVSVAVIRDYARYQYLRDKDAFGADNEPGLVSWDELTDLEGDEFDAAIDARMSHPDITYTAPPAPAVPDDVAAALDWIDDFIARCNGDDRGACQSVNVIRAALQLPGNSEQVEPVSSGYTLPDGWIKCSERIPSKGERLLVYIDFNSDVVPNIMKDAEYTGSTFRIGPNTVNTDGEPRVTHWQPLPAAPKGVTDE